MFTMPRIIRALPPLALLLLTPLAALAAQPSEIMRRAEQALAAGDPPAAHAAARAALLALWRKMPLHIAQATFVRGKVRGYGFYEARGNARFAPGEKLRAYLEPAGYGFVRGRDGRCHFRLRVDVALADTSGKVLVARKDFATFPIASKRCNFEFFLTLDLDIGSVPPGRYRLLVVVHDEVKGTSTSASLPFEITS